MPRSNLTAGQYWSTTPAPDQFALSLDGRRIVFVASGGAWPRPVPSVRNATFEARMPVALFPTRIVGGVSGNSFKPEYAVSREERFLINETVEESTHAHHAHSQVEAAVEVTRVQPLFSRPRRGQFDTSCDFSRRRPCPMPVIFS